MFAIYILFSDQLQKHYVGYTHKSVNQRLEEHLHNHQGFTAKAKDWKIVFQHQLVSKTDALLLERKIKKRGASRY
ncbi:GIY-YIG nuclease family protein, partial [Polaribacter sp. IC066]